MAVPRLLVAAMVYAPRLAELQEWVAYHLYRGAAGVVIYDHGRLDGGSPGLERVRDGLRPWLQHGQVELRTRLLPESAHATRAAVAGDRSTAEIFSVQAASHDCFRRAVGHADWVAWIDIDEFLVPLVHDDLPAAVHALAAGQPDVSAMLVEMRRYGSSGHVLRPAGLLTENYTWRERDFALTSMQDGARRERLWQAGNYRKSILRPHGVGCPVTAPHRWQLAPGQRYLDAPAGVLRLDHYVVRSMEDFVDKFMLGGPFGRARHNNWNTFRSLEPRQTGAAGMAVREGQSLDGRALVCDLHMRAHVPAVREALARHGVVLPAPRGAARVLTAPSG